MKPENVEVTVWTEDLNDDGDLQYDEEGNVLMKATDEKLTLTIGNDYIVVEEDGFVDDAINVGDFTLKIQGQNGYIGTAQADWHIVKAIPVQSDFEITNPNITKRYSQELPQITSPTFVTAIEGNNEYTKSGMGTDFTYYFESKSYDKSTTTPTAVGTYNITFDVSEGANYRAGTGFEYGTLTITEDVKDFDINSKEKPLEINYDKKGESLDIENLLQDNTNFTGVEGATWTWSDVTNDYFDFKDGNITVKKVTSEPVEVEGKYTTATTKGTCTVYISVTPKVIPVTGSYVITKLYDGNNIIGENDATDTLVLDYSCLEEDDSPENVVLVKNLVATLSATAPTYKSSTSDLKDEDAGPKENIPVYLSLSGDHASNYTVESSVNATASITKRALAIKVEATSTYGQSDLATQSSTITGGISDVDYNVTAAASDLATKGAGTYENYLTISYKNAPEKNYNVTATSTLVISKAGAPNIAAHTEYVLYTDTSSKTLDVNAFSEVKDVPGLNITELQLESNNGSLLKNAKVHDTEKTKVVFNLNTGLKYDQDAVHTLTFTAKSTNYDDATLTILVKLTDKADTKLDGGKAEDGTYNGEQHDGFEIPPTFTGYDFDDLTITYAGTEDNDKKAYGPNSVPPTEAGTYTVTFKIPENLTTRGDVTLTFKINPKPVNVYPALTITDEDIFKIEDIDLIFETLVEGDPEPAIKDGKKLEVKVVKKGTDEKVPTDEPLPIGVYDIKWINKKDITYDDENYSYTNKDNGVLTVTRAPNRFRDYDWSRELRNLYNQTFIITAFENEGGTISNPGDTIVKFNKSVTYEITPADGYVINYVLVDGQSVGAVKKYTFKNVQDHHTIVPVFKEAPWVSPYSDVASADWFYEDVAYVNKNGFMTSTDTAGTKFSPNSELNRATVVTVLWRMQGSPIVTEIEDFIDVPSGEWYTEATRWAAANGIVKGFEDYSFHPTEAVTHEQLCAILRRYADYLGIEDSMLVTVLPQYDYSTWAENDVIWASMNGLLNGIPGMLDLTEAGTRAEFAAFLRRLADIID